jgi:hypothetical protein
MFSLTFHARQRMAERMIRIEDIGNVGFTAYEKDRQSNGRWKLVGKDLDGDELAVICIYDGGTLVVTIY